MEQNSVASYKPRQKREGETSNNIWIENDSLCQPVPEGNGEDREDHLDQYSI